MKLPQAGHWKEMITYDYVICEICGKKYQSVSSHVRKQHQMDVWDYKEEYGYNRNQPLESGRLQEKRSRSVFENDTYKNIVENEPHQFKRGHKTTRADRGQYQATREVTNAEISRNPEYIKKRVKKLKETVKKAPRDNMGRFTSKCS